MDRSRVVGMILQHLLQQRQRGGEFVGLLAARTGHHQAVGCEHGELDVLRVIGGDLPEGLGEGRLRPLAFRAGVGFAGLVGDGLCLGDRLRLGITCDHRIGEAAREFIARLHQ